MQDRHCRTKNKVECLRRETHADRPTPSHGTLDRERRVAGALSVTEALHVEPGATPAPSALHPGPIEAEAPGLGRHRPIVACAHHRIRSSIIYNSRKSAPPPLSLPAQDR
ncbi:MAG TPA: hypothetical protein VKN63_08520, partial [Afifellaceae bacterium]|nr:hypothetical protein [Afifellaceae bacterium]